MKNREKFQIFKYSLRLLLISHPRLSMLFIAMVTIQGLIPTVSVMASIHLGNLVNTGSHSQLLIACLIWAFTFIFPGIIAPVISTVQSVLNQKSTQLTQHKIMLAISRIQDLKIIESNEIHDKLEVLSKEASHRPLNLLVNLVDILRGSLTLLSMSLVLASVAWWLPLALLLPAIPVTVSVAQSQLDIFKVLLGKGMTSRLIRYYFSTAIDVRHSKEIKLFNLSGFFINKHRESFYLIDKDLDKVRKGQVARPQKWNFLYFISAMGVMFWFSEYVSKGDISTGGLLGTIQSIGLFGLSCQWMVYSFSNLGICFSFFEKLMILEKKYSTPKVFPCKKIPGNKTIKFENVSFSYHKDKMSINNVNLKIMQGDHIAIVGENGAGKSTLIKLLCRLYIPDQGRITIGGIDINEIDIEEWHSTISAIFQDFGHYNLTIKENVFIGDLSTHITSKKVSVACQKAQFTLREGLSIDSQIGKEFDGTELSGGEWQRLALARAFYADRPLVILDEPTSAMDPRVESELFSQFGTIMAGKTAVMVTHRLGSVRDVNRVVVMKAGRIVEEGPPQVLEALNGEYAELLALQKNQYAERPSSRTGQ
ncbi:ATP-binding cassette domain-containing protein [Erwinia sp. E602]|uniref:ABC transporter ATP-binding protein n=1 Tax=Erwinia sp. E602 TaxID=2675378 RepID=UPI001BAD945E|nr:ABC transporter ATP-binding protein [Erwinia sp. E602]QUG75573.1 ATP-binding cassette domain-containing protein [Erwinia sp. E602]